MSGIDWLILANFVLLTRLYFLFPEERLSGRRVLAKSFLEWGVLGVLIYLPFGSVTMPSGFLTGIAVAAALGLANLWSYKARRKNKNTDGALFLQFLLLSALWAVLAKETTYEQFRVFHPAFLVLIYGGLFSLNEANLFSAICWTGSPSKPTSPIRMRRMMGKAPKPSTTAGGSSGCLSGFSSTSWR